MSFDCNAAQSPIAVRRDASDPCSATGTELAQAFATGRWSPVDVCRAILDRIDEVDSACGAFFVVDRVGAMESARAAERRWKERRPLSPLDGVPYSVKDHIAAHGLPSTWGCASPASRELAARDSAVVARLREAGAVLLGKTRMSELGFYCSGSSLAYGATRNPWNLTRTAGGSSGGAAAAVAAGLGPIAIGSDGGGSIRIPASFTGVVGYKPSGGRVPMTPTMGRNPVVGPICRGVQDTLQVMNIVTRPDPEDFHSLPYDPRDISRASVDPLRGLRVGLLTDAGYGDAPKPAVKAAVERAADVARSLGAAVERVPPPFDHDVFEAVAPATLPVYAEWFGPITGGRIDTLLPTSQRIHRWTRELTLRQFLDATHRLAEDIERYASLLRRHDVLLTPTMPDTAFGADDMFPSGARTGEFGYAYDFACFVHPVNLCALPAITLPYGMDEEGLPIGIQFVGPPHADHLVLSVASDFERTSASTDVRRP